MGYTFEKVEAKNLRIDPQVQRSIDEPQIRKLMRDWNPELVGVLIGSRRDDGYVYLADGQQRRWAAFRMDPQMKLDVKVHDDWTQIQEGRMFQAVNQHHKAVSTYDKYRVAVNIGSFPEKEIDDVIVGLGLQVGRQANENTLACPATLLRIAKGGEGWQEVLKEVVRINMAAGYHFRDENQWDAMVLEGWAIFLRKWMKDERFDMERVNTMLRDDPFFAAPRILVQQARANTEGNNRAVGEAARLIQKHYNKRIRARSKKLI